MSATLAEKKKELEAIVAGAGRAAVACSGGVDSTLLLKVVHDVLGDDNTIAVFAETPLLPDGDAMTVRDVVNSVGSRMLTVKLNPLDWRKFTRNPPERCYICKKKIYRSFLDELKELHFSILMDGTNLDDLSDFRPGLKALHELGVITPLAAAGMTKKDVRRLSRNLNLPNWNRYSSSCLATRVATGEQISPEKLQVVKKCENFLQGLEFFGCRVRLAEDSAFIELLEEDINRLAKKETRAIIFKKFNDFNIKNVFIDLRGRKGISV